MEKTDTNHTIRRIPFVGGEPNPGTLVEMLYRPDTSETAFAIYNNGQVRYEATFPAGGNEAFIPYSPKNNLLKNRIGASRNRPVQAAALSPRTEMVLQMPGNFRERALVAPLKARYGRNRCIVAEFGKNP